MIDRATIDAARELFMTVGFPSLVALYLLYKDFKLAVRQTEANEKIASSLGELNAHLAEEKR